MVHKDNVHGDIKPPKVTTYVLVGYDRESDDQDFRERGDVSLIRLEGTISKETFICLMLPANIHLIAHGSPDAKFAGRDYKDLVAYSDLFESLPKKGIYTIILDDCFSESAMAEAIKHAPAGTIIQTKASATNVGLASTAYEKSETKDVVSPVDIYLETLDNFPKDYRKINRYWNEKNARKDNKNPNNALPSRIGIGGEKGAVIDFDETYAALAKNPSKIDSEAMDRAIERVQERFDTQSSRWSKKEGLTDEYGSSKDERALDKAIETVAANLHKGRTPRSFEERRIALALAAAYTEETGELAAKIREAGGVCPYTVKDPKYDARGNGIAAEESVTPSQTNPLLTKAEERYIATVNEVLTARPKTDHPLEKMMDATEIKEVITQITAAFSKTEGSDALGKPLADKLAKAYIATRGWER